LSELPDLSEVIVAGMVVSVKTIVTKKGLQMAFIELEDRVEKVEVVLFPETWKRYNSLVHKGELLLIKAKLQQQDEDIKLLADQVVVMNNPEKQDQLLSQLNGKSFASKPISKQQRVFVKISEPTENQTILAHLKALLTLHKGDLQVVLFYEKEQKSVALNNQYNVNPSESFIRSIEALMGSGTIKVQ
jgi:DNA polymerase-3 subunit alpha